MRNARAAAKCLRPAGALFAIALWLAPAVALTQQRSETARRTCVDADTPFGAKIFSIYGAHFFSIDEVELPSVCVFQSAEDVARFHQTLKIAKLSIAGITIELQEPAARALGAAIREAASRNLRITPLDGAIAGKRDFADTVAIWNSRFLPALEHWVRRRKISRSDADRAMTMSVSDQVNRVLEWEALGYYFSTGKNRPIFSSVAPPGTSQHLSLLAFDIEQQNVRAVREILNRHGWFQTVVGDSPHFTFLGVEEAELTGLGLRPVYHGGYKYWVPAK